MNNQAPKNKTTAPRKNKGAKDEVLEILRRIESDGAYANRLLELSARSAEVQSSERGLVQQLVKGTLQQQSAIDTLLGTLVHKGIDSLTPSIRNILRFSCFQLLFMDNCIRELVVNEAVEMAKKNGHQGTAGLVNAVLRKVTKDSLEGALRQIKNPLERLSLGTSHPLWLIRRWVKTFGEEQTRQLCEFNNTTWPVSICINPLKTSADEIRESLKSLGVILEELEGVPGCFNIIGRADAVRFEQMEVFNLGHFHIIDPSSVLVAHMLDPKPGNLVVDMCSAPGGKACVIAELMQDKGCVLASDMNARRVPLIRQNAQRLGLLSIQPICADGAKIPLTKLADCVLVDAPCSGSGVLGRKSDLRWNRKESDVGELNQTQRHLLDAAASMVKPGGRLVYSTCSIEPDENADIAKAFLVSHGDFQIAPFPKSIPTTYRGNSGFLEIFPHQHRMGGAFAAAFLRVR